MHFKNRQAAKTTAGQPALCERNIEAQSGITGRAGERDLCTHMRTEKSGFENTVTKAAAGPAAAHPPVPCATHVSEWRVQGAKDRYDSSFGRTRTDPIVAVMCISMKLW
jgi:hypothetical protein